MNTIINISSVTDYSGEIHVVTYSNPVTTVIIRPPRARITERVFGCCQCNCNCNCNCCNRCSCCGCLINQCCGN